MLGTKLQILLSSDMEVLQCSFCQQTIYRKKIMMASMFSWAWSVHTYKMANIKRLVPIHQSYSSLVAHICFCSSSNFLHAAWLAVQKNVRVGNLDIFRWWVRVIYYLVPLNPGEMWLHRVPQLYSSPCIQKLLLSCSSAVLLLFFLWFSPCSLASSW